MELAFFVPATRARFRARRQEGDEVLPPQSVEQRVEALEQKVSELEQLPIRMAEMGSQIEQLRGEMHLEFSAIRIELAERPTFGTAA